MREKLSGQTLVSQTEADEIEALTEVDAESEAESWADIGSEVDLVSDVESETASEYDSEDGDITLVQTEAEAGA